MTERKQVLIVDDSLIYRRLLANLLAQWGYGVSEAENGEEALAMMAQTPFSMVISDWEMPVMDGLALCRAIRNIEFGHYVYLILLTARESADDLTEGFEAGVDDFLSKPVNQSELRARLHAGSRILALEASLAAHNNRLTQALSQIEQDLQVAARLQRAVLPAHQLRYEAWFADWLFLPSAWVSGDIFNIFPLDGHLGFYFVDVAGHGVGAAMMSLAVARQFLHGRVVERFLFDEQGGVASPADVVQMLNTRFCSEDAEVVSYFTLIYGVIDRQTGCGTLCQAGHPTPFIVSPDGRVRQMGNGGAPVGLLAEMCWEDTHFTLHEGERLCLFSDGITECEGADEEQFGDQRLQQWITQRRDHDIETLLTLFGEHLTQWRNPDGGRDRTMTDDVSLLIIERRG
ncbi:SpoIIE family protein phosphatase [Enterobacter sp. Bisph1]|uniref:PP2C family protein-serine/threonine phosphatase n=1 Tax=Enterobacter sp. Bisph1 TaxID=1274399 RepID=UPI00057BEF7A|nr:SpoIIE family protein phosphatase [Enterobacter sp. Bisph1]